MDEFMINPRHVAALFLLGVAVSLIVSDITRERRQRRIVEDMRYVAIITRLDAIAEKRVPAKEATATDG